jgi:phage-related protein
VDRLERMGATIREPWSKSLGDGLYELRFSIDRVAWRIPYFYAPNRRAVLLTVFRKQRNNERQEVTRARQSMRRCITDHQHGERNEP